MDKKILARIFVIAALFVGLTVNSALAMYNSQLEIDNQCPSDVVAVIISCDGGGKNFNLVIPTYSSRTVNFSHSGFYVDVRAVFRDGATVTASGIDMRNNYAHWTLYPEYMRY